MKENLKKIFLFFLFISLIPCISESRIVYDGGGGGGGQTGDFMTKVKKLVGILIAIVFIVSVIELVFAGVLFATAQGEPEKLNKAKNILFYAVIGIGVASIAWALANFVYETLK